MQGAGAAIVAPAALSLITTGFPEGPQRTRAIGLYGAVSSVGFVAGQVLGGVLVQFTSWRAVFLVNVPVGLVAAALSPAILGCRRPPASASAGHAHRLDLRGALLITCAVTSLVFAVSQGVVLGLDIAAGHRGRRRSPPWPRSASPRPRPGIPSRSSGLSLLHRPGLRDGTTLTFLLGLWNGGEMLVLSLYLQQVPARIAAVHRPGHRPARRGRLRHGHARPAAGPPDGRQAAAGADRRRDRTRLRRADPAARDRLQPAVLFVVTLIGFGTAGTALGSIVLASRGMADADQGLVGGMINTSRQIGAAVGAALLPAVAEAVSGGPASPATAPRCSPPPWPPWPPPPSPGTPPTSPWPAPAPPTNSFAEHRCPQPPNPTSPPPLMRLLMIAGS